MGNGFKVRSEKLYRGYQALFFCSCNWYLVSLVTRLCNEGPTNKIKDLYSSYSWTHGSLTLLRDWKFTALCASTSETLLKLLVLAPSPSHDCVQGYCREQLPYRVNQFLTSSSPRTLSFQDNPPETTEIACSTDSGEREGHAVPLLFPNVYRPFNFVIGDTPLVTILYGVRTTTANGGHSLEYAESDFVRMDAQVQMRKSKSRQPNTAFCSTWKLASDISTQSKEVLVVFIVAFEAFIARRH